MKKNQNSLCSVSFWERKTLDEMNQSEWESVCDGCGLCCLTKLQDDETEEIVYTRIVCDYSDLKTGGCTDYANRSVNVPTCVQLTKEGIIEFDWLPDSCAYRMLYRGQPLPDWHPLVSGTSESLKAVGIGLSAIDVIVTSTVEQAGLEHEHFVIDKP
ncbi:UPF0260 protein YcgN [hydrothermal vent metagenome]|uniref:UPF0260 protein YcgN n=1 Tax=hydrothermal vent metagenome TaxID=652676 RepID=A0A3B0VYJ8_9ZZZZ